MASGLVLEMVNALLLMEAVFHLLPSPLPAARPLHTLVRVAVAHALLSAPGAPTTGGGLFPGGGFFREGGFFRCIRASPIRFQASLILDRHLS